MRIDFLNAVHRLSPDERDYIARQMHLAARYHDVTIAGFRIEFLHEAERVRCRVTAVEEGGSSVVVERAGGDEFAAAREAANLLDRALHTEAMRRPAAAPSLQAA